MISSLPFHTELARSELARASRWPKVRAMIYRYLLLALLLAAPAGVWAQLRVELEFEQETYLPHEPLYAIVRIYNSSGQTLVLGKDNSWLTFHIESAGGGLVMERKPVDVQGEFRLPSGSRARKMVNLAEAFELTKMGRYITTATVHVADWGESFTTARARHFGIATGVKLWEQAFGIPSDKPGKRPEIRKFQLMQANHLKQLNLYVRIVDETGSETFTIYPLGPLVGFSRPEAQLDRWSNLHIMYQDKARSFRYFTVTPDGLLLTRQSWEVTDESRPTMTVNSEGRISVTGGVRRVSGTDLPPPELVSEKSTPAPSLEPEQRSDAEKTAK